MDIRTLILFFVSIIIFGLGLLVLSCDPKRRINRVFFLLIIPPFFWVLGNALFWISDNFIIEDLATKFIYIGAALIAPFFLYFSIIFPDCKRKLSFIEKTAIWFSVVFFSILVFAPNLLIEGAYFDHSLQSKKVILDPLTNSFYNVVFLFIFMWGYYNLFSKFFPARGFKRKQIGFVITGTLISFALGTIFNMFLPWFGNFKFIWLGSGSVIIWVVFIAIAILKHRLFNIKIIATETITALIVLILLIQTLLSKTLTEGLIRGLFLILMVYFGYLLIKSVIQEIERRKEVEKLTKELEKANKHLKKLDKMKSEFVSIASHDLLTPVAAIEGYLSMILDEKIIPIKNHKLKDFLQRMYGSSKRLARLIADLLNISRIEEGRLLVDKKPCDIAAITETVVKELAIQADKHHLYLRFEKPTEKLPKVFADSDQVKEVLTNLIGNGIKFTKTGGVIIKLEILAKEQIKEEVAKLEQEARQEAEKAKEMLPQFAAAKSKGIIGSEQVVVHVKDTGIGIPQEELPNLFRRFYRGEGWSVSNIQGTGLGLYISKSLIELHNGRIWVDSEKGKGSDFAFSLPLAKNAQVLKQDKDGKIGKDEIRGKPMAKGPEKEF